MTVWTINPKESWNCVLCEQKPNQFPHTKEDQKGNTTDFGAYFAYQIC